MPPGLRPGEQSPSAPADGPAAGPQTEPVVAETSVTETPDVDSSLFQSSELVELKRDDFIVSFVVPAGWKNQAADIDHHRRIRAPPHSRGRA
jgi:hypothetical protein